MSVLNKHPQTKIQNFSVETVRNILKIDNKGIAQLCAKVSLMPKKDIQGRTYFTRDDVEILRRIKTISDKQKTNFMRTVFLFWGVSCLLLTGIQKEESAQQQEQSI